MRGWLWITDGRAKPLMERKVVDVSSLSLSFSLFLSLSLTIYLPTYLSIYLSIYLSVDLSIYPSIDLSIYWSIDLSSNYRSIDVSLYRSIDRSIDLSIYLSLSLSVCLSVCLSVYLQACKRSNSARLPSNMESWVQSWRPHTIAFCDFPLHLSKVIVAPATKKRCQVIRSAAPVTQNHLSKPEDLRLQNATPLRKSAPGPPNISDEHVSCTAPATENASFQILFKCPTPAIVFGNATKPSRFAHSWHGPQSLAPATRNDICLDVARACGVFHILTSKCASRQNGVHFFDIATSKNGANVSVFSCFTCKCASHHNGMHFFDMSTSKKRSETVSF